jgi:hypothetical protein
MRRCPAITRNGEPCKGIAATGSEWCPAHNPARAEARKRAASKAAKAKGGSARTEVEEIRRMLRIATDQLLRLEPPAGVSAEEVAADDELRKKFRIVSRSDCAVLATVLNVRLRLIETERRIREQEEVLERIGALEALAEQQQPRGRWVR